MATIQSFVFDETGFEDIKNHPLGRDWPIVYIIENGKDVYIGETTTAFGRSKQHFEDERRLKLKKIHLVLDDEFNKSATLDLESQLIQYFSAEGKVKLQNLNKAILLLTNLGQETIISEGVSLGVRGYLIKSDYTPDNLVKEIKEALK